MVAENRKCDAKTTPDGVFCKSDCCKQDFSYLKEGEIEIRSFLHDRQSNIMLDYYVKEFLNGSLMDNGSFRFNIANCGHSIGEVVENLNIIAGDYANTLCVTGNHDELNKFLGKKLSAKSF